MHIERFQRDSRADSRVSSVVSPRRKLLALDAPKRPRRRGRARQRIGRVPLDNIKTQCWRYIMARLSGLSSRTRLYPMAHQTAVQ